MLTTDRVAGAALVALGLFVLVESRTLPLGSLHNPGPAYAPVVLAILVLVFGALVLALGAHAPAVRGVGWVEWRHAVAIFVACAFAALALERLGFRITIAVTLFALLRFVERRGWTFSLAFALVFAVALYVLFQTWLRVPLPLGPFRI
jgi:putative tricarboxylic transport membrane protein